MKNSSWLLILNLWYWALHLSKKLRIYHDSHLVLIFHTCNSVGPSNSVCLDKDILCTVKCILIPHFLLNSDGLDTLKWFFEGAWSQCMCQWGFLDVHPTQCFFLWCGWWDKDHPYQVCRWHQREESVWWHSSPWLGGSSGSRRNGQTELPEVQWRHVCLQITAWAGSSFMCGLCLWLICFLGGFSVCVCFVFVWFWFFLKKIKLVDIRLSQLCALAMSKAKVLAASATM